MANERVVRTLFIFKVGMDIRNDLDALKRAGWIVEKHTHIINQQADGSKWVSIFIRRTEKE